MKNSDNQLFLAVFFNQPEMVKKWVEERTGNMNMEFSGFHDTYSTTALECAIMLKDTLEDIKHREKLEHAAWFKPMEEYQRVIDCIEFLKPISQNADIDYSINSTLVNICTKDDEFIREEEMQEYLKEGYRLIDLQLINSAYRRDESEVRDLLKKGANPFIDPFDKKEESAILDSLEADDSFAFTEIVSYRSHSEKWEDYEDDMIFHLFHLLYKAGSSSRLFRVILSENKIRQDYPTQ
jgi:hypothetical protein